jgi:hypothetical protein
MERPHAAPEGRPRTGDVDRVVWSYPPFDPHSAELPTAQRFGGSQGYQLKNNGSPWASHPVRCFTPPRSSLCFLME